MMGYESTKRPGAFRDIAPAYWHNNVPLRGPDRGAEVYRRRKARSWRCGSPAGGSKCPSWCAHAFGRASRRLRFCCLPVFANRPRARGRSRSHRATRWRSPRPNCSAPGRDLLLRREHSREIRHSQMVCVVATLEIRSPHRRSVADIPPGIAIGRRSPIRAYHDPTCVKGGTSRTVTIP